MPVTQEVVPIKSGSLVGPSLKSLNTNRIKAFFICCFSNNPADCVPTFVPKILHLYYPPKFLDGMPSLRKSIPLKSKFSGLSIICW